ncbi:MAG: ABC transporter ATP-binding protein [Ruminococcus sp.]|nr:ABC transporter ATP-binding protein [Candidatus Apopatosoma intestinale]
MSLGESELLFRPWLEKKTLISCKSVCKSFKNGDIETTVLKGVSFDVFEGEFLCLLGESGCGKSTFLNIIGGLERADSGTIKFMDEEYQNASEEELTEFRRKNIGFVFQSYNLMPNLTSKQNLDLIGELVSNPMDSAEALNVVGLSEKMNSYPSQLSGGQQQRVSIARAIVKNPKVIMADEPTAALDYKTSIEVLQVFSDIVNNGTALIMVTHNEEITKMADRVIRFRDGKVYEVTINNDPKNASELVW